MRIVVVEEKCTMHHEYEIAESTTESQLDMLERALSELDHPGDILRAFDKCGISAISRSCDDGDWQRSEIEFYDEYEGE